MTTLTEALTATLARRDADELAALRADLAHALGVRDAAMEAETKAEAERDTLRAQRDEMARHIVHVEQQRNQLESALESATAERDEAIERRDVWLDRHEALKTSFEIVTVQRDAYQAEAAANDASYCIMRDAVEIERKRVAVLTSELVTPAAHAAQAVAYEREADTLRAQRDAAAEALRWLACPPDPSSNSRMSKYAADALDALLARGTP